MPCPSSTIILWAAFHVEDSPDSLLLDMPVDPRSELWRPSDKYLAPFHFPSYNYEGKARLAIFLLSLYDRLRIREFEHRARLSGRNIIGARPTHRAYKSSSLGRNAFPSSITPN